ncbi:hypothetical protein [Archangium lansingense]|uniref:Lipoprotein n=1 Tax=Archangium lansingense TaxID=2995310 RepID=A0ABT4AJ38_9BACT|nr:hypothetical protein [Archangium lansinium]MCY1081705.1 hypothetical protein [Archangium lansinium]
MRSRSLAAVALIFAVLSGCTCGGGDKEAKKGPQPSELLKALPKAAVSRPSALVPKAVLEGSPRAMVVAAADARGAWDAFLKTAPGKALVEGGAIEHVGLSAQMERALSLSHDLATASEHPLAADRLAEAFSGPAAVGVMDDEGDDADFVVVKEVDGSQEFVVRLALMASTLKQGYGVSNEQYEGHPVKKMVRGKRTLWVAAFQNVLIASTNEQLAKAAVSLALGKGGESVESIEGYKKEVDKLQGHRLAALVSLEEDGPAALLLGLSQLTLGLDLDSGQLQLGGELSDSPDTVAAFRALAYVPKDAVFFSSLGAANASAFLERLGSPEGKNAKEMRKGLVLPSELEDSLTDEAFYGLLSVEDTRFNHLLGLGVKDAAAANKAFSALAKNWLDTPEKQDIAPGVSAFCNSTEGLCLALAKDYLLAATDLESLTAAVETGLGKRPALSDVKGFQQVGKSGDARFLTAYVDTAGAADAMLTFFRAVGRTQSQSFDTGDVDASVAPLCEAMKKLPPYGGGLTADGTAVAGQFQPLPVQQ